jgi:hypothetical protein
MKIQKKILAREIIILFSLFGLICLFYLGIKVWNWNVNRNIAKTEGTIKLINQDLYLNGLRIDSIKNRSQSQDPPILVQLFKVMKDNGMTYDYETFKNRASTPEERANLYKVVTQKGLYEGNQQDFENIFLSDLPIIKKDVIPSVTNISLDPVSEFHKMLIAGGYTLPNVDTFRKDMSDPAKRKRLHATLVNEGDYTKSYEAFDKQFFSQLIIARDAVIKMQNPNLTQSQTKKQVEKDSFAIVQNNYRNNLISNQYQTKLIFNFALISFLLVYVLRGIIFALKWSIKALKEQ